MKRPLVFLLGLLLFADRMLSACPSCAEAAGTTDAGSIWPIVGAFLVVPPMLFTGVVLLLRRELKAGPGGG